jgi:23S rRNA maturation-related 3'-5' exoribonuclease YhaM
MKGMINMLTKLQIKNIRTNIVEALRKTKREGIEGLITYMDDNGFFTAPASKSHHQNYMGGLAEHSLGVMGRTIAEVDTMQNKLRNKLVSIVISSLLHDLCKIDQYLIITKDENGIEHEPCIISNSEADWRHSEKSIEVAKRFIVLTEEEEFAIRYHMGIYRKDYSWDDFGNAIKKYPLVYLIHVADMKDTYEI